MWINEEDHYRVISMDKTGNMKDVFTRFCDGLSKVEALVKQQGHEFMWNEHLGYIHTCPSNLGTGLRAGVHIKLVKLSEDKRFAGVLKALRLQKRGTGGVDTAAEGTYGHQLYKCFTLARRLASPSCCNSLHHNCMYSRICLACQFLVV